MARDKASLDIFWLKDDSLDNLDDLPPPDVLQQEIIEHLERAILWSSNRNTPVIGGTLRANSFIVS
jgi:hypothetical protein